TDTTVLYTLSYTTLFRSQAGNNLLSDVFGASDGYTTYYSQRSGTAFFTPGSANFNVTFSNTAASINARMYVDYLRFNYKRPLSRSEEHTSELQSRENLVC